MESYTVWSFSVNVPIITFAICWQNNNGSSERVWLIPLNWHILIIFSISHMLFNFFLYSCLPGMLVRLATQPQSTHYWSENGTWYLMFSLRTNKQFHLFLFLWVFLSGNKTSSNSIFRVTFTVFKYALKHYKQLSCDCLITHMAVFPLSFFFFLDFIYLFLERGREKERKRNINV